MICPKCGRIIPMLSNDKESNLAEHFAHGCMNFNPNGKERTNEALEQARLTLNPPVPVENTLPDKEAKGFVSDTGKAAN